VSTNGIVKDCCENFLVVLYVVVYSLLVLFVTIVAMKLTNTV